MIPRLPVPLMLRLPIPRPEVRLPRIPPEMKIPRLPRELRLPKVRDKKCPSY